MAESLTKGKQPIKDPKARNKQNQIERISSKVTISGGNLSGDNLNLGTQRGGVMINKNAKGNNNEGGRRNHGKPPIEDPEARDKNKTEVLSTVNVTGGDMSGDNLNLGTQQGEVTIYKNEMGNNNEGKPRKDV